MSEMVRAGIVRIYRESDQQVVGVGFLVDAAKRTILTCAHVVSAAIGNVNSQDKLRSLITLDFPFINTEQRLDTRVTHLFPKTPDITDDIAVLEILDDLPEEAKAVQLATADTYSGNEFSVYGFPHGFEEDGQYVEGKLQERLVNKCIQAVGISNLGHFVAEGFSGSPVYDKELKAVVGMMMSIASEREKRVAYICPADVIATLYSKLIYTQLGSSSQHNNTVAVDIGTVETHFAHLTSAEVRFSLTNFTGKIVKVTSMVLEIVQSRPCLRSEYSRAAAPIDEYFLHAKIDPSTTQYELIRQHHELRNQTEGFFLKIEAIEGYYYELRIILTWKVLSGIKTTSASENFSIEFPFKSTAGLLKLAQLLKSKLERDNDRGNE